MKRVFEVRPYRYNIGWDETLQPRWGITVDRPPSINRPPGVRPVRAHLSLDLTVDEAAALAADWSAALRRVGVEQRPTVVLAGDDARLIERVTSDELEAEWEMIHDSRARDLDAGPFTYTEALSGVVERNGIVELDYDQTTAAIAAIESQVDVGYDDLEPEEYERVVAPLRELRARLQQAAGLTPPTNEEDA